MKQKISEIKKNKTITQMTIKKYETLNKIN